MGFLSCLLIFLLCLVLWVMRKTIFKWITTRLTGRCQLVRILDNIPKGAKRTAAIEKSLQKSALAVLRHSVQWKEGGFTEADVEASVEAIMKAKDIKSDIHPNFEGALAACITQVLGYRALFEEVEQVRKSKFDPHSSEHMQWLTTLWCALEPDVEPPGLRHELWETLGFQSDDPTTDFRGMGLLCLHNLIHFATKHSAEALHTLSLARHPQYGYSFAIVGVNLTELSYRLLKEGQLKKHFYNSAPGSPTISDFHEVYCWIFTHFDSFWRKRGPIDVMEFNPVRAKFEVWLKPRLSREKCHLTMTSSA